MKHIIHIYRGKKLNMEVHVAGDALKPGKILDATEEACLAVSAL